MRKIVFILGWLLLILLVSCTEQTTEVPQDLEGNIYNVEISNFAFLPDTLTINQGDTVIWINSDSAAHTETSDSGSELDSAEIAQDQTYSHVFNSPGTYSYYCTLHPRMKASIRVQ